MHQSLIDRIELLKSNVQKVDVVHGIVSGRVQKNKTSLTTLSDHLMIVNKCNELFKSLLETAIHNNVTSIEALVTSGLSYVINDQKLVFKIVQEHKNNRLAMRFQLEQDGVLGDPLSSFGGGAAVVVSLILRIAFMQRLKLGNLLILDESMVALANAYVPNAADFMKQLSEQTGINILMVTHNNEFLRNAHLSYECIKTDSLHLRKLERSNEI